MARRNENVRFLIVMRLNPFDLLKVLSGCSSCGIIEISIDVNIIIVAPLCIAHSSSCGGSSDLRL